MQRQFTATYHEPETGKKVGRETIHGWVIQSGKFGTGSDEPGYVLYREGDDEGGQIVLTRSQLKDMLADVDGIYPPKVQKHTLVTRGRVSIEVVNG